MPVLGRTHNEGDWFVIQAPTLKTGQAFSGTRQRVTFTQGEARTDSEDKARLFSEVYGYDVMLPTGHPGWEIEEDPTMISRFGKPDDEESPKRVILDHDSPNYGKGIGEAENRRGPGRPKKVAVNEENSNGE